METRKLTPQDVVHIVIDTYCTENKKPNMELNLLAKKCVLLGAGKKKTALGVISNMIKARALKFEKQGKKVFISNA